MAQISYGSITIVDVTDIGQFSVYPRANAPKTQIYNPDADTYIPNWDTSENGGTAVTISPVAYYAGRNVTTSATYTWKRKINGTESSLITGESVNGNSLVISKNILADINAGLITYVCTAHYIVDDVPLEAIGEIDFSLVKQGSAAKIAKITGENVFKVDTNGSFGTNTPSITLTAIVNHVNISSWRYYDPDNAAKDGYGYVTYPGSSNTTSLVVRPTDAPFNNSDIVRIKLATDDANTYDIFTITILRDGAAGDSVISAVLTNEDQMIPADKNGNPTATAFSGAETEVQIYKGGNNVTSEWTITKTIPEGITESSSTQNISNRIKIEGMTVDTANITFTCQKTGDTNNEYPTFNKVFSLIKVKAGADGQDPVIYTLEASGVVVNETYEENQTTGALVSTTRTPGTITFNAYKITGDRKEAYSGRIQFYVNGSSSISNALNSNVSIRTYDFSENGGTRRLRAVLYEAGANTNELDSQTVIVVSNGRKGAQGIEGPQGISAVNLIVGNEADVIPCDPNGHPFQQFTITIPFEGYQGTVRKPTTVKSNVILNKTTWGTSANIEPTVTAATGSAAGSIVYNIPTTATVPNTGQITYTYVVQADDGNVEINKTYTWTASKAATNGENAVILQVLTPDGTIFDNGSGRVNIRGVLYDGPEEATEVTYHYYKYGGNGNYNEITTTTNTDPAYLTANGLIVTGAAIDGYASFKIETTYNSKTYTQYVSLIDKSDPLQISVHSTIGTQIKNKQGVGCMYARVTREGVEIDPVPFDITAGIQYPATANDGDYFVKLTAPTDSNKAGSASLMKRSGSQWVAVETRQCTYEWTYRNVNNVPLTDSDTKPATMGQFVYIDGTLIQNKITADVKVTLNN